MSGWDKRNDLRWVKWVPGLFAALIFLVPLGIRSAASAQASTWKAPEDAKSVMNPEKVTPEGLAAAKELFAQNCIQCHGANGNGNGPSTGLLPRRPPNFTDAKFMSQETDGELFWKMTKGRAPMPSWGDTFTETQRWQLVNYIRSLGKDKPTPTGEM